MSNYNNENKKKRNARRFWRTASLILVSVLLSVFAVGALGGLDNVFEKDLNPDNLLKYEDYVENLMKDETEGGMHIKWKDDGSFALWGKHSDDDITNATLVDYEFVTVVLEPGTYTLSANNKDAGDNFGLYALIAGETEKQRTDDGVVSFDVTEGQTAVSIGWYVKNNQRLIYEKIEPTLVAGDTAIEFYK